MFKMSERSRQMKNAARSKRSGLLSTLGKIRSGEASRSDTLELKAEDNVFDMVDEEEYQKLVEDRRKNTDFVVDDGKLTLFVALRNSCCESSVCLRRKPWILR